ncbi:MAG TPA: HD domain-containing protein [bacterium]|nr:HD domain-containing protein [bacterium]HPT29612.1 HD domain-containing protein [bacterium]
MKIPEYALTALNRIWESGYEAYFVGGAVRDLLMGKDASDWDLATSARPEQILDIFSEAKYENSFGTVILPTHNEAGDVLEITTYRSEKGYNDRRHPDEVCFEDNIEEDLKRRDFTVNALALTPERPGLAGNPIVLDGKKYILVDLFGGQKDIEKKIIRAVGEPVDRFKEDALRLMRAIRFTCQLGFGLEDKTGRGIVKMAGGLKFIAPERIHDELIKILSSDRPEMGIRALSQYKLLQYIIPELEDGKDTKQHYHHIYPVLEHNLLSLKYCPSSEWPVRLAALLHDVGKPKAYKLVGGHPSFYNHEYIGAKMTERIMKRLKFSTAEIFRVVNLVRNHMFYYQVGEVTAASVRRLIAKTGRENLQDLIDLRVADRLGSGLKSAVPYKLRHLQYMMEKVQNDPVSVKMLKINGHDLMTELKMEPSPKMGAILEVLLAQVIEDPELNTKEYLLSQARELSTENLESLRSKAQEIIAEKQEEADESLRHDFKV